MIEKNINNPNKITKPELPQEITKWLGIFASCSALLLNPSQKALGNMSNNGEELEKGNNSSQILKQEIRTKIALNINGFIKAVEIKHPNIINSSEFIYHYNTLLDTISWNIENHQTNIRYNLSKDNIDSIRDIMYSIAYLLDLINGIGYSSILLDGEDHSKKDLVIDVMYDEINPKIHKISIEKSSD